MTNPFLRSIHSISTQVDPTRHPYNIPAFAHGIDLEFSSPVTFFVGENGSGKSTLLEAIAENCGFNPGGGNRNHRYSVHPTESNLSSSLRLAWLPKVTQGFFLRAESFFNFATYLDEVAEDDSSVLNAYGGKSLHQQSHGESFLSLFLNHFDQGLYILDEPEAALSPGRQLSFLKILHDLTLQGKAQFLIATHSPMLITFPGAEIYRFETDRIAKTNYPETEQYQLTRDFLNQPERFYRYLLSDESE